MRRGLASSPRQQTGPEEMATSCTRGDIRYKEKLFPSESGQALKWPAQGGGGVTVPGSVKRCLNEEL